jgi:hypothetical protein
VHPLIFRNQGATNGSAVKFKQDMLSANDFPNAEDRAIQRTGTFFDKMIKDRKIIYTAAAPSADYDGDGRIDLFLTSWWTEAPAMLLKNETAGGNWLTVKMQIRGEQTNRDGIGARVRVYPAGKSGEADALLGCVEIAAGYGYSSGQEPVAHFGLGRHDSVDLVIHLPHGRGQIRRAGVKSNQRILIDKE